MAFSKSYTELLNKVITLQEYIDRISKGIQNNRVRAHLNAYLRAADDIDNIYGLSDKYESEKYEIDGEDGITYKYFIRKILSGYYCLYISVPRYHPLFEKPFNLLPNAVYGGYDRNEDRWVFGWDYGCVAQCYPANIELYMNYDEATILNLNIITSKTITMDINKHIIHVSNPPI